MWELLLVSFPFFFFFCPRTNETTPYAKLPGEAWFANSLGMLILVFGLLVLWALSIPTWKRPDVDLQEIQEVKNAAGLQLVSRVSMEACELVLAVRFSVVEDSYNSNYMNIIQLFLLLGHLGKFHRLILKFGKVVNIRYIVGNSSCPVESLWQPL